MCLTLKIKEQEKKKSKLDGRIEKKVKQGWNKIENDVLSIQFGLKISQTPDCIRFVLMKQVPRAGSREFHNYLLCFQALI